MNDCLDLLMCSKLFDYMFSIKMDKKKYGAKLKTVAPTFRLRFACTFDHFTDSRMYVTGGHDELDLWANHCFFKKWSS